jgi:putative effector of murein hydrolase
MRRALVASSAFTVVAGALQVLAPGRMLRALDAGDDATARQLFGTVGVFMATSGATLLASLRRPDPEPGVLLGAAAQKAGASAAMAIGVSRGILSTKALGVVGIDLASALFAVLYSRSAAR